MSFHYSAEDIRIEDGHILKARLQRADGEWNDSEIDLNNHIGNDNGESYCFGLRVCTDKSQGSFYWDGVGFSGSAHDIEFAIEGGGSVPVLRATLVDQEGNGQQRDINLSERISNNNGDFNYSEWPALAQAWLR